MLASSPGELSSWRRSSRSEGSRRLSLTHALLSSLWIVALATRIGRPGPAPGARPLEGTVTPRGPRPPHGPPSPSRTGSLEAAPRGGLRLFTRRQPQPPDASRTGGAGPPAFDSSRRPLSQGDSESPRRPRTRLGVTESCASPMAGSGGPGHAPPSTTHLTVRRWCRIKLAGEQGTSRRSPGARLGHCDPRLPPREMDPGGQAGSGSPVGARAR